MAHRMRTMRMGSGIRTPGKLGAPGAVFAARKAGRGAVGRRDGCACAAARKGQRGGKGSGDAASSSASSSIDMAVGSPEFERVDSAFGAIKDWNGNLDEFKMETDLTKVCDPEELAEMRKHFEELIDAYTYKFSPGDRVTGLVLSVGKRGAQVEIGAKLPAFCPAYEAAVNSQANIRSSLKPGTEREFEVIEAQRRGESLWVSARVVDSEIAWRRVVQLYNQNTVVKAFVKASTRGGVIIDLEGIQGFIPKSHMGMDMERVRGLVGKHIDAKFLEADPDTSRLVMSHRMAKSQANAKDLEVGSLIEGKVVAIKEYGAFVDLGLEFNALLHVSQISYSRLFTVDQVLAVGDPIKAMVLSYDASRGRVSLSTKKLEAEPGEMLRSPAKVFQGAEKMAQQFRERMVAAEAAARASANDPAAGAAPEEESQSQPEDASASDQEEAEAEE